MLTVALIKKGLNLQSLWFKGLHRALIGNLSYTKKTISFCFELSMQGDIAQD